MIISLHDSNLSRVCYIDNSLPEAMHYSDDSWNRYLQESTSTFDFKVYKTGNKYESFLNEKNYVSFSYGDSQYLFSIMRTEEDENSIKIYAENLNLELLNETKQPIDITTSSTLLWYLNANYLIEGSGITVGINEVSDKTRKIKLESEQTGLARLISIANNFGAEIEFVTSLNPDGTLKSLVTNFYKKYDGIDYQGVGRDRQDVILEYGKNIESITRTVDKTDVFNTIVPVGKDGVGIESIEQTEYNDKGNVEFYTKAGSKSIYAPISKQLYRAQLANDKDGWIQRYHTLDGTSDVSTLYTLGLNELRKHAYPAITYDVKGFFDLNIGDTVRVFDSGFSPILLLKARVAQQTISFSNPSQNKTTFGNIQSLENRLSKDITSRLAQLVEEATPYRFEIVSSDGLTFKNSTGQTTLTARVFKGTKVDEVSVDKFEWTINGIKFGGTSKNQLIKASDINGTAVVRYNATIGVVVVGGLEVTIQDVSDGSAGRGIKDKSSKWQLTTTTAQPTDDWFSTKWKGALQIATAINKYLWQIDRTTYTDDTTSDLITLSAVYGDTGATGATGATGSTGQNGQPGKNGTDGKNGSDGQDALNLTLSNQSVTIPATYDGSVQSYSGTGTRIDLTEGNSVLQYDGIGTSNGTWKVSATATGITCGAIVDSGAYATVANHSGMAGDSASIEYTITGKRTNGANFTIKASQSFSKSKQGIVGVSSYTWIRYSANSNGASMTLQPGADTKYIGLYAGTRATAPTSNIDYTWSNYVGSNGSDGAKGDPTGVTKQATEPASAQRFLGMIWQYTGTTSLSITGTTATPNAMYRWTGTSWELWYFYAANIQADAAFFNLLNVSSATVANLGVTGAINANLIAPTPGNLLFNPEIQSNAWDDGWTQTGSLVSSFYQSAASVTDAGGSSSQMIGINSLSEDGKTSSNWSRFNQDVKIMAGFSYSGSAVLYSSNTNSSGEGIAINILFLDKDKNALTNASSVTHTVKTYTTIKLENQVAPTGAVYLRFAVIARGRTNSYATRMMLNIGATVAPYSPNGSALTITGDMIVDGAVSARKVSTPSLAAMSAILGDVTAGTYTSWNFSDTGVYKYLNGVYLYDGHLRSISIENSTVTDPDKNLTRKSYLIRGSDMYGGVVTFFNNKITTSAKPNDLLKGHSFFSGSNQAAVLDSSRDSSGASALDIKSDNVKISGHAYQTIPWTKMTDFSYYKVMFGRVNIRVKLNNGGKRDNIYLGTIPNQYKSAYGDMMLPAQAWYVYTDYDKHVQYNTDGSLYLLNPELNTKYVFEVSYTL